MKRLVLALTAAALSGLAARGEAAGYGVSLGYALFNTGTQSLSGPSFSGFWTPFLAAVGPVGIGARLNVDAAFFTQNSTFNSSVSLGPIVAVPLGPVLAYVNPALGISYLPAANDATVNTFYVTLGATGGVEFTFTPSFGLYAEATYETLFSASALRFKFGVSFYD
jgi:hypothetical protein